MLYEKNHQGAGMHTLVKDHKWQICQLNYAPEFDITQVGLMKSHFQFNEVVMPMHGEALLLTADLINERFENFEVTRLQVGSVYEIPANSWHQVLLSPECQLHVLQSPDADTSDFGLRAIQEDSIKELKELIFTRTELN